MIQRYNSIQPYNGSLEEEKQKRKPKIFAVADKIRFPYD